MRWHCPNVWEVGRAVYGAGTALSEGRIDDVLAALRRHGGSDEARPCAGYVETNHDRMRYPGFRAAGLPVGSGVVESACDTVAGRLKRGGMHWVVKRGANRS